MGQTREQKILKQISGVPTVQKQTPIMTGMFLPNHSGITSHPEYKNDDTFLKIDGSNANQDIDIGSYDFSCTILYADGVEVPANSGYVTMNDFSVINFGTDTDATMYWDNDESHVYLGTPEFSINGILAVSGISELNNILYVNAPTDSRTQAFIQCSRTGSETGIRVSNTGSSTSSVVFYELASQTSTSTRTSGMVRGGFDKSVTDASRTGFMEFRIINNATNKTPLVLDCASAGGDEQVKVTGNFLVGGNTVINKNSYFTPITSTDAAAPNNSIYYSSTASKLVYKDAGGTVNNLY